MSDRPDTVKTCRRCLAVVAVIVPLSAIAEPESDDPCTITPSPYWKNTIQFPDDPFQAVGGSAENPNWVKFTVLNCDPEHVYYQDCTQYQFHYEFATELLDPFMGMTPEEYEQVSLYEDGQEAHLGALIIPPVGAYPPLPTDEYGIQFARNDPYDPQEIVDLFELVRSSVVADPEVQPFYFPSYEQLETAEANREFFEAHGIIVSSTVRWAGGNGCYSQGWALGELKFVEGSEIEDAYLAGTLDPDDILLTDGVPAEVPFVAGILTLAPSTPSSHVAILANTFNVPFVHLALVEDADRAQQLVGHRVALRAYQGYFGSEFRLIDVEGVLTGQQSDEILALKDPPVLSISPIAEYGAYSANTDGLVPSDIHYFGGKAANFGFLRRAIPDRSPVALGISFDLWDEFLDQTLSGGGTLREEITALLSGHTYPPDMFALAGDLDDIRDTFKDTDLTSFTPAQEAAIIAVLQDPQYGFDPNKKIRFRSSTNMEDSEHFTGAGLYDSYSGCLADDLDGDDDGPSICDPSQNKERGVFRAIRKVFASFYNDNAFLERLRHGVTGDQVGMALLVHHSFPDEIELANGVGTLVREEGSTTTTVTLVTQVGAVSVSNPEDGSIPEEVQVIIHPTYISVWVVRGSNLLQLGATVLEWDAEYEELAGLLASAADTFEAETGKNTYVLDFEYKKVAPGGGALPAGGFVVKQIRELPQADTTPSITPFLINEPTEYCTAQANYSNVFAIHRIKTLGTFQTGSFWLTEENLAEGFWTTVDLEHASECNIGVINGPLGGLPEASYAFEGDTTTAGWVFSALSNPRSYELQTDRLGLLVAPSQSPLLTLGDYGAVLRVEYDVPVPTYGVGGPRLTTVDEVTLGVCPQESSADLRKERVLEGPDGVLITTSFYWPPNPYTGVGYTNPLGRWEQTVIEGLTSEPIVLHGYFSQTYRPTRHNVTEYFIFDPFLEPGVPRHLLQELLDQDIRLIHVQHAGDGTEMIFYGHDGTCVLPNPIPAVSDWGIVVMMMLVLTCGTLVFLRRRRSACWCENPFSHPLSRESSPMGCRSGRNTG